MLELIPDKLDLRLRSLEIARQVNGCFAGLRAPSMRDFPPMDRETQMG